MNTLNIEYDFVILSRTETFYIVYNGALSNLKNLILKFHKNIILT